MGKIKFHSEGVKPQLDPRTQYYVHNRKAGLGMPGFAATAKGEMPVTAKVTDLEAWKNLTEVTHGSETYLQKSGKHLVTAIIPISQAKRLSRLNYVQSLKVARTVKPVLKDSNKDMGISPPLSSEIGTLMEGGKGVVVGVIDYGGDPVHEHFRDPQTHKTRLDYIWNQGGSGSAPYGKIHTREEIDAALDSQAPYATLGYRPGDGSHGTHVMDIAAGSGSFDGQNSPGIAPEASLAFVHIATLGPGTVEELLDTDFGDSVRVIEAVKHIFAQAGDRPCVVNLSLGTNGGPHDGTNPVEEVFDAVLEEKSNRAIVVSASNSYSDGIHKMGTVAQDGIAEITWNIPAFDSTYNEVEIWYSGRDRFEFDIIDDQGRLVVDRLQLNESGTLYSEVGGQIKQVGYVVHKRNDEDNGDNVIHIFQDPNVDRFGGTWKLRVYGKHVEKGEFHAWIERDDRGPTEFLNDDQTHTLGSISTSHKSIAVGSYDAHRDHRPISYFSSSGPTRDGRNKPEVSAPGHAVFAASSGTKNGLTRMSGTSMSAPAVTGLIAQIFAIALQQERDLTIDETRGILFDAARKDKNGGQDWHPRYGYGRASAESLTLV